METVSTIKEKERYEKTIPKIVSWLQQQVKEAEAKGVVFGLSGGLDSSVTAILCKRAFPENSLGLILPCHGNPEDREDARFLAKKFNLSVKEINLDSAFEEILESLGEKNYQAKDMAVANLKPRLRMLTLYYYANKLNYLVVGSGNKSELMVGYFTKYGDGGVDLLPLGELYKTQVKELAKSLKIPEKIIQKEPSAGLWKGQTDEKEIGISYEELDKILLAIENKKTDNLDLQLVKKVKTLIKNSEHKRNLPKICKLK